MGAEIPKKPTHWGSDLNGKPVAPPGVSVDENMRRARQLRGKIMGGLMEGLPTRKRTRAGRNIFRVVSVLMALAAGGCSDDLKNKDHVIQKTLRRPGGGVSAFLVRHDTWDHVNYEVFVRQDGDPEFRLFLTNSAFEGPPELQWTDPDTLIIRMKCGYIEEYSNAYMLGEKFNFKEVFVGLEGNRLCKEPAAGVKSADKP